jgi:hypothetical protein
MATGYAACYAFGRQRVPYGPWGPEGRAIHVAQPGTFKLGYTLCGTKVSRLIGIFSPGEATCRECKRRWELSTGRR